MQQRPVIHQYEGNATGCGASTSVLCQLNHQSSKAWQANQDLLSLTVCSLTMRQISMVINCGWRMRISWRVTLRRTSLLHLGFMQRSIKDGVKFIMALFPEFGVHLWAGLCTDGFRLGMYVDATGLQVSTTWAVDVTAIQACQCSMHSVHN